MRTGRRHRRRLPWPLGNKKFTIGLKGLWGQGVGRYGTSTIADVTVRPNGVLPLQAFSALSTVELNPTPRFNVYFNYGGDYVYRDYVVSGTNSGGNTYVGYGVGGPSIALHRQRSGHDRLLDRGSLSGSNGGGTGDQTAPANCGGNNKDVQEFTAGYWFNIYSGPKGRLRQGITYENIRRDIWSGNGGTASQPRQRRARRRQHVLHLVPLLPAVTSGLQSRPKQRGSPHHGLPLSSLHRHMKSVPPVPRTLGPVMRRKKGSPSGCPLL